MTDKMAFITHFSTKWAEIRPALLRLPRLPAGRRAECACRRRGFGAGLAALCLALVAASASAEGINASRATASLTQNGQLSINSRFQTDLPDQLQVALKQGVPLNFELSYRLQSPTWAAYRSRLSQLVGSAQTINYKLTYHPLTDGYRVTVGTFSTEYGSLQNALRAVGAVANWQVLNKGALSDAKAEEVAADVRLSLSISDLPRPFQINGVTSKNWQLDSGWQKLTVNTR